MGLCSQLLERQLGVFHGIALGTKRRITQARPPVFVGGTITEAATAVIAIAKMAVCTRATAGIAIPALVVGQLIGFPLRKHLHGERFRWMVLGLLAAAATSAILGAVL